MNPGNIMGLMSSWNVFKNNHPKFPAFMNAVKQQGINEGTIIEIAVTGTDGKKLETNIKVTQSDLELFESLKSMR